MSMRVTKEEFRALDTVSLVEIKVTSLELILSIADGYDPGIYFKNHDLEQE